MSRTRKGSAKLRAGRTEMGISIKNEKSHIVPPDKSLIERELVCDQCGAQARRLYPIVGKAQVCFECRIKNIPE